MSFIFHLTKMRLNIILRASVRSILGQSIPSKLNIAFYLMKYKWGREIASVSSDKFPIFNLSAKFLPILLLLLILIADRAFAPYVSLYGCEKPTGSRTHP